MVFGAQQSGMKSETFFAAVVVNWNDNVSLSTAIDLVLIGATDSPKKACTLTDLWTGTYYGIVKGQIITPQIYPHDHMALNIKCSPVEDEEDLQTTTFLL
jgi:hypothetical protein